MDLAGCAQTAQLYCHVSTLGCCIIVQKLISEFEAVRAVQTMLLHRLAESVVPPLVQGR
jgi:hypothetical protein